MHLILLSSLVSAVLAAPWNHAQGRDGSSGKTAYFLDNDPSGSSIVSLKIGADGKLSNPVRTLTGGNGAIATNKTGFTDDVDTLDSQGSVVVSGDLLFTVNAGSDTLAMFKIDPSDPQHPSLVGNPADTLGQFPQSVTYSEQLKMACVLNGGAVAGVTCFDVDATSGLSVSGSLRQLGRNVINETTPPTGPPGSAAQVFFDPESTGVFVTVKGNAATTPPTPGWLIAYPVTSTDISYSPVFSQFPNITMDFGVAWVAPTTLFLSDPSFGIALLDLQPDFTFTQQVHTVIPKQKAICWAAESNSLNTAYAMDAGRQKIYEINSQTGAHEGSIDIRFPGGKTAPGAFDAAVDQQSNILYALVTGNGVIAVDLEENKQIQFLDLSSFGSRVGYMGMAIYHC